MPERSNRFWIAVMAAVVGGVGLAAFGLPAAYRVYHERKVADLEVLARACLAEGKDDQAAVVLEHYLQYRPQDVAAHADHARLRFEQSRQPGAGKPQLEKARTAISAALSKSPDDPALRRREKAERDACADADTCRNQSDGDRVACAAEDHRKDVAAHLVGAEPVRG